MRARTYDPVTGRFTSRDPQAPDTTQPESYNSYTFANGNPLIYADPAGQFSVVEINVAGAVKSSVEQFQNAAVAYARKYAMDKAQEMAAKFVVDAISKFVPMTSLMRGLVDWARTGGTPALLAGRSWEDMVSEAMGELVGESFPNWLWLFTPIENSTGKALANGVQPRHVQNEASSPPGLATTLEYSRPDFLISSEEPIKLQRTLLIGDIKLTGKTLVNDYTGPDARKPGQFQAIVNHSVNYGMHVSVFLTITRIARADMESVEELVASSALKNGGAVFVISLF